MGALRYNKELMGFRLIKTEVVSGGPGGQVSELSRYGGGIVEWNNEEYVLSIFEEEVASGKRVEVGGIENEGCRPKGRALDDTGRDTAPWLEEKRCQERKYSAGAR